MSIIVVDINGTPHKIADGTKIDSRVLAMWFGSRCSVMASNEGDLFDPLDERDRKRSGMFWRLQKCSRKCYDQYTIFLRSKNRTPYILAQRRFRNDF